MACWLDKKAQEQAIKLRDEFNITEFVETGTFKGVNAYFQSYHFPKVVSCEIAGSYLQQALVRTQDRRNIKLFKMSSPQFLKEYAERYHQDKREDIVFIFLDAHFYDNKLLKEDRFVVLKELQALKGFHNCIICIHDFDCNGLGHICYDGVNLNLELVKKDLMKINPHFKLYFNTKEQCDIYDEKTILGVQGLTLDEETKDNMQYAWSKPEKTYRGFLWAIPRELDLTKYELTNHD